jgi:hypothetical protein
VDAALLVLGVDILLLYVTAIAAEESNLRATGQDFGRVKGALAAVSAEQFPLAEALFHGGVFSNAGDGESRVQWANEVRLVAVATST